ncbi:MAG: cytochrome P450 [Cytophagaceae bacterium]
MNKTIPKIDKFPSNWLKLAKKPLLYFTERTLKNRNIVDLNLFLTVESYLLCEPEYIEHVMVKNNKNYKKGRSYEPLKLILGNGLLTSEGDFWKRQRRIAQPAFHKKVLAGFTESISNIVSEMIARWDKSIKEGNDTLNIADEMMKLTVHITSKLLFGADISGKEDRVLFLVGDLNERSINMLKTPVRIPLWLPTPGNLQYKKNRSELFEIINEIILKRRKSPEGEHHDLLQMLMDATDEETGEQMTDLQLRDEVITLFLAGSETSSNALAWTFHLFCQNRDKEEKARMEIDQILVKGLSGLEALRELRYLNMVMQESMRIFPPAWFISREALNDDEIDGYKIPKKTQVYISIHGMHNHPRYWEEPEKFIPERFEQNDRPKYAYFPFGGGPRLCIGIELARMEVILGLFELLQEYTFEQIDKIVEPEPLITLRPKNGLHLKISKRKIKQNEVLSE